MLADFRLKVFMTVAKLGNFTKAAKALNISQPAISQNITNLEKLLNAKLFNRIRGDVSLTSKGMAFMAYVEKIMYWYAAADAMFGNGGKLTVNKPIVIASDSIVASYILPKTISIINATNPNIVFDIISNGLGNIAPCDAEIYVAPSSKNLDFVNESKLVGVIEACIIASPNNKEVYNYSGNSFSNIDKLVVWNEYKNFLSPDLMSKVSIFTSSIEAVKAMVGASSSLAGIIPNIAGIEDFKTGDLVKLPINIPEFTFDVYLSPNNSFATKPIYNYIKQTLTDYIKTML